MLTYDDCLALCGLEEEEVEAVARHEHLPEIVALELAAYLVEREGGEPCLKRMILDDIVEAEAAGDLARQQKLRQVLRHFLQTHPRARSS